MGLQDANLYFKKGKKRERQKRTKRCCVQRKYSDALEPCYLLPNEEKLWSVHLKI